MYRKLLLSVISLMVLLAVSELMGRLLERRYPPRPIDIGQSFEPESRAFVPAEGEPGWIVTNPLKSRSVYGMPVLHEQRFTLRKDNGSLRIVFLGASSVYALNSFLPSLAEDLSNALGEDRSVEMINAGCSGFGSHRLVAVVAEVLGYDPDAVLVYTGNNEFIEKQQMDLVPLETLRLQKVLNHSALFRVLQEQRLRRWEQRLRSPENRALLAIARPERVYEGEFARDNIQKRMKAYEGNLNTILTLCRRQGVPVILGTVPSNLLRPVFPNEAYLNRYEPIWRMVQEERFEEAVVAGDRFLKDLPARHQSSPTENTIIRKLARRFAVPLADVDAAIRAVEPHGLPGETMFTDHCHLTEDGNRILMALYRDCLAGTLGVAPKLSDGPVHQQLGIEPDLCLAYRNMGGLFEMIGRRDAACAAYAKAFAVNPDDLQAIVKRGDCLKNSGMSAEADALLEGALARLQERETAEGDAGSVSRRLDSCVLLLNLGRREDVVAVLSALLSEHPDVGDGRIMLAWTLLSLGRKDEAVRQAEAARELLGNTAEVAALIEAVMAVSSP